MRRSIPVVLALAILFALPVAGGELEDRIAVAENGDAFDQAELGSAFYFGNGVPQPDISAAISSALIMSALNGSSVREISSRR